MRTQNFYTIKGGPPTQVLFFSLFAPSFIDASETHNLQIDKRERKRKRREEENHLDERRPNSHTTQPVSHLKIEPHHLKHPTSLSLSSLLNEIYQLYLPSSSSLILFIHLFHPIISHPLHHHPISSLHRMISSPSHNNHTTITLSFHHLHHLAHLPELYKITVSYLVSTTHFLQTFHHLSRFLSLLPFFIFTTCAPISFILHPHFYKFNLVDLFKDSTAIIWL